MPVGLADPPLQPHDVIRQLPDEPDSVAAWHIELGPADAAYRAVPPLAQAAARLGAKLAHLREKWTSGWKGEPRR